MLINGDFLLNDDDDYDGDDNDKAGDQFLVEVGGTSPLYLCQGLVPLREVRDLSNYCF